VAVGATIPPSGTPRTAPYAPVPSSQLSGLVLAPPLPGTEEGSGQAAEVPGVAPPLPDPAQGPGWAEESLVSPHTLKCLPSGTSRTAPSAPVPSPQLSGLVPAPPLPGHEEGPGQAADAPGLAPPLPGPSHGPRRVEEAPVPPHTRRSPIASLAASKYFRQTASFMVVRPALPPLRPLGRPHARRDPSNGPSGPRPRAPTGPTGGG